MKKTEYDKYTKDTIRAIASNIRAIREKKGLTQEDVEKFDFNSKWYQEIERGVKTPTLPTLCKLAKAFRVDLRDFFKGI
ncbi:MAG: helix-turn-helix transcriptional regulator [Xanthomonadaceae bacterium]|nr:helix-turn-helix transcriptional regulator [Xanthomonadaceae bacterium]